MRVKTLMKNSVADMVANHSNWQQLGIALRERLNEVGDPGWDALRDAGLLRGIYLRNLLNGRVRFKLAYVAPFAKALNIDEDQLFWTALEGMLEVEDVVYFRKHFNRLKVRKKKTKNKNKNKNS